MGSRSKNNPHSGDGASPGKIFIGGLAKDATEATFNQHFGKYGEITDSVIMKDRYSGQPRGFGFITYADASVVDKVIEDTHIINGKQVEIKRTIPKGAGGSKESKTKKIFVGGLPSTLTEDDFKDFFSKYGKVKEHQIIYDHETKRPRGFGFIVFESEEVVDEVLANGNRIDIAGTQVRRSQRLRNIPKQVTTKKPTFFDLTEEEAPQTQESVTKGGEKKHHAGIMRPLSPKLPRGHYSRQGKTYVSLDALKEQMAKNRDKGKQRSA